MQNPKGPIDLNYGRGNDWYEDNKDYEVNPNYYKNTIGFPMQDNHGAQHWAPTTMLYGIDKRFYNGVYYNDGTDLGIAYNMIRPGTREKRSSSQCTFRSSSINVVTDL